MHDGVVEQSMFMGAATHYWIGVAGKTLRAITTGGATAILPVGQQVKLRAAAGAASAQGA